MGRIGIVDFDVVEESNLQRQIIHGTEDLAGRKIESARDRLRDINPHIEIETHETRLTSQNAMAAVSPTTTSSSTAPTTFPLATSSTTPAC